MHKGGSRQLELAVARKAREANDVSKYAPSELEAAEDVGVPHVVDLVLDEVVVVDEALAAKRALSAASSKENREAKTAREATAARAARAIDEPEAVVADIVCMLQAWSKARPAATAEAAEGSVVKQGVQRAHELFVASCGGGQEGSVSVVLTRHEEMERVGRLDGRLEGVV
ncbi:hypothetical protein T492DRAFT_853173 [Pavlovales sp. CCMP2436]|nr:hypothetical protein T492DRAFT_853173 [Pavlovales sp. CCMP2436]